MEFENDSLTDISPTAFSPEALVHSVEMQIPIVKVETAATNERTHESVILKIAEPLRNALVHLAERAVALVATPERFETTNVDVPITDNQRVSERLQSLLQEVRDIGKRVVDFMVEPKVALPATLTAGAALLLPLTVPLWVPLAGSLTLLTGGVYALIKHKAAMITMTEEKEGDYTLLRQKDFLGSGERFVVIRKGETYLPARWLIPFSKSRVEVEGMRNFDPNVQIVAGRREHFNEEGGVLNARKGDIIEIPFENTILVVIHDTWITRATEANIKSLPQDRLKILSEKGISMTDIKGTMEGKIVDVMRMAANKVFQENSAKIRYLEVILRELETKLDPDSEILTFLRRLTSTTESSSEIRFDVPLGLFFSQIDELLRKVTGLTQTAINYVSNFLMSETPEGLFSEEMEMDYRIKFGSYVREILQKKFLDSMGCTAVVSINAVFAYPIDLTSEGYKSLSPIAKEYLRWYGGSALLTLPSSSEEG